MGSIKMNIVFNRIRIYLNYINNYDQPTCGICHFCGRRVLLWANSYRLIDRFDFWMYND